MNNGVVKHKGGEAFYSMHHNIENSSLEFKNKLDAKVEITVERWIPCWRANAR